MSKLAVLTVVFVAFAVADLAATTTAAPAQAAPKRVVTRARSHAFDGMWSVSILTKAGPCNASYRYPARIVGGQVMQTGNDFSYQISGAVVASGAILVTVSQGGQSATGYGRLRGASGGGGVRLSSRSAPWRCSGSARSAISITITPRISRAPMMLSSRLGSSPSRRKSPATSPTFPSPTTSTSPPAR